jgi:hypothetical protein
MQQPCSSHAHGPCWLLLATVAGCSLLLAAAAGCWLLLVAAAAAASPGEIFEEILKFQKFQKKGRKFFRDTLSRIVIDHKNDHHPPPPAPSN